MKGRRTSIVLVAAMAAAAGLTGGCSAADESETAGTVVSAIVHGADDRRELFEVSASDQRMLMSQSVVALIPRSNLRASGDEVRIEATSYGEVAGLCAGEPFFEQPAAAFCSGVLIDDDLVLTSGHCLRLYALRDFVIAFGYAYAAPGELALRTVDLRSPVSIVNEALDAADAVPRLDYGFLRLDRPATGRRPAHIGPASDSLVVGEPMISIGAVGGTPLKLDAGARVEDTRVESTDFFVASTDTAHGSSGGGAFDASLDLVGVLARGGEDFVDADGCYASVRQPEGAPSEEQFTYASRALEALCSERPEATVLCGSSSGAACRSTRGADRAPGCALAGGRNAGRLSVWCLLLLLAALREASRRSSRRACTDV